MRTKRYCPDCNHELVLSWDNKWYCGKHKGYVEESKTTFKHSQIIKEASGSVGDK